MQCPRILVVTGAAGVGKTTLVRRVEARGVAGASFHSFDDIGVLDAQVRPDTVQEAFATFHVDGRVLLLDCRHDVREARLRDDRGQPELATPDMAQWARYLRGQADALGLPVLDTSALSLDAATDALHAQVSALAVI